MALCESSTKLPSRVQPLISFVLATTHKLYDQTKSMNFIYSYDDEIAYTHCSKNLTTKNLKRMNFTGPSPSEEKKDEQTEQQIQKSVRNKEKTEKNCLGQLWLIQPPQALSPS